MITLNYRDARPIYEQVRDGLRRLIVSGAIADGEKLPSVRALAQSARHQPEHHPARLQRAGIGGLCRVCPGKGQLRRAPRARRGRRTPPRADRDPARNAARAARARHDDRRAGRHLPGGGREMIEIRELVKTFDGLCRARRREPDRAAGRDLRSRGAERRGQIHAAAPPDRRIPAGLRHRPGGRRRRMGERGGQAAHRLHPRRLALFYAVEHTRHDEILPRLLSAVQHGALREAARRLFAGRKAAHPPSFQGNAEAGGVLDRHVLYAGLSHSG